MTKKTNNSKKQITPINIMSYPVKILAAWKEAIKGNRDIRTWLIKNGYKELGIFVFALNNDRKSRLWLKDNGYAHLLAMIAAAEGDKKALFWLKHSKFEILYKMALSIEGDKAAKIWLQKKDKLYLILALQMESVKDNIEMNNNDPHKLNP